MAVYWVTFRFSPAPSDRGSYEQRLEAFQAVFSDLTNKIWAEPAAFIVFEAAPSIEVVAALFQEAIDPSCDMFLLHEIDGEDAIIGGAYADLDILSFMPHLKTLV
jgi:hypothetical protein